MDRIATSFEHPSREVHWRTAIRDSAIAAHAVLSRHPWAGPLLESRADAVRQDPQAQPLTVDLERQQLRVANRAIGFEVDPGRREALLKGLDEIGVTLQREPEIAAFQARDRTLRPWIYS